MYRQLTILFVLLFNSALANADAFLLFEQFMDNAKNINLRFSQVTTDDKDQVLKTDQGNIDFVKPDKFLIKFDSPDNPLVISDGKTIWIYEESLQQVIVQSFSKEARTGVFAVFAEGISGLQKDYVISSGLGGDLAWINAKAIEVTNNVPSISLGFSREDGLLKKIRVSDSFGGKLEMTIEQIKFGVVDEAVFQFVPPEDTEVVKY